MRNLSVTIFNRKANGEYTLNIEFETVDDFMRLVDEAIDSTDFYKVNVEFDDSIFNVEETDKLRKNNF